MSTTELRARHIDSLTLLRLRHSVVMFRGNGMLIAGCALLLLIVVCSLAAPLIAPSNPTAEDLNAILVAPGTHGHLLGTDEFGRDLLSRILYAGRADLILAFVATAVPMAFGIGIGALAGYAGGWFDALVSRIIDVIFAFPFLVLVLMVVAVFGPGLRNMLLAIWAVSWVAYARLVRGEVLSARSREYVLAARALNYHRLRIVIVHVLPNVASSALVYGAIAAVNNLTTGAALGFLGLGVQPPSPEWGSMIADAQNYLTSAWWLTVAPGVCIVLLGLSLTMIGDSIADRLHLAL